MGVEKRSAQQDTVIAKQKEIIAGKDELIENYKGQVKTVKRKKNRQRLQFGLIGVLLGTIFGLSI